MFPPPPPVCHLNLHDAGILIRSLARVAENPDCHGVNFYDDGQPGGCVHASEWEFEPKGGPLAGQTVVAIPVNKRP